MKLRALTIETLNKSHDAECMTNSHSAALVLGGSGRTGSLVARLLADRGMPIRITSRHGSTPNSSTGTTGPPTPTPWRKLTGSISPPPVVRVRYADQVAAFLDRAEQSDVRHVTLLSTYNGDHAPTEIDVAAVEADLANRQAFTHSILRPAWVMQNFVDEHLPVIDGTFAVPSEGGAEAFVDAADIAAVAAATLLKPKVHAGTAYTLTGPEAITFDQVAATIAAVSGQPVTYQDIEQLASIDAAITAGVPADYAPMLTWLTAAIITGHGSTPTADVEKVLGRPPTSFQTFGERNAAAWAREHQ